MELALLAAGLVVNITTLIIAGLRLGPAKRARRRTEVAEEPDRHRHVRPRLARAQRRHHFLRKKPP